nr:Rieske 2Fe-2S domain-containing protein [uncultured Sphingomonas sp.]
MVEPRSPLPIPFGWFAIGVSSDFASGGVYTLNYFDTEFVLWRGQDGKLRALDPFCPHLGAHLGKGGEVVGNDLQCPFHHWTFEGQGIVTGIPYTPAIPPQLKRPCGRGWRIEERFGVVYTWFHPAKADPLWELAAAEELENGEWDRVDGQQWRIGVHVQEITENGVDYAHFRAVHGTKSPPEPTWEIKGYQRNSRVTAKMETPRGLVDGTIVVRNTGPGQSFIRFHGISELLVVNLPTPINREATLLRQEFYVPKSLEGSPRRAAMGVARNIMFQVEQDMPIWENKRFEPRPILVRGDGPILDYRKQYAQYYAEPVEA